MFHIVYVALGSNLGDRMENLRRARGEVAALSRRVINSPIYETPPWGYVDQPAFLNQVIQVETERDPEGFLRCLKQFEYELGRQPSFRFGPRLIDLDILFYDDLVLATPEIEIPHPRLHQRAFVLVPLNDLAPDLRHPILQRSIRELVAEVDCANIRPFA